MKTILLVAFFTVCYVVCMDLVNKYMSNINFESLKSSQHEIESSSNIYTVSITGSVVSPGQYTVTKDSTLGYLITLAGGILEDADITAFNSNANLANGKSYYISHRVIDENNISTKVSLNTATEAQLDTLPGIGEVFAKRIVEYRVRNGNFKTIEDVMNVNGIKEYLFDSLKDLICL